MFQYLSLFLEISWISKTQNCPFRNKTKQDFADFSDFCGNFKVKTKIEDEEILKKKDIFTIFASPHYFRWRDTPNVCYVKHPNGVWQLCEQKIPFNMLNQIIFVQTAAGIDFKIIMVMISLFKGFRFESLTGFAIWTKRSSWNSAK